jgi:hypothetical protein
LDFSLVITRLVHIISGTFWVGTAIYLAILLEPRIRSGSVQLERELLSRTSKLNSIFITSSAILAIGSGFGLISMTPGRSMDQLGENAWGMMMLVGLMTSIAAFFISGFAGVVTARLRRAIDTGTISDLQLANIRQKLSILGYLNAVLVVIAIGTMAVARFV